jgi:hypothetical protein
MSITQSTPTTARPATPATKRTKILRWAGGSGAAASLLAVIAIAAWPASEADKARDDGEQLGAAVSQLYNAQSADEVDAALTEVQSAASDTRDHAGDQVAERVGDAQDALSRAADGFVGTQTSTDAFEVDLYQAELNEAVDDLDHQANDVADDAPEVRSAFWDGYETGFSSNS